MTETTVRSQDCINNNDNGGKIYASIKSQKSKQ